MENESVPTPGPRSPETAVTAAVMRCLSDMQPGVTVEPPSVSLLGRDALHDLVAVLWRAALERYLDQPSMEALLWVAVRHGETRRRQGYTEEALLEEYRWLQQALTAHATARLRSRGSFSGAGDRVQAGITLCVGGAIRGFHRDALDAAGDWPQVVQRFLRAFHPPGTGSPRLAP
jgi:hypothetical protein